ncbi:carbohydrate ABC transporter permease [Ruania alba]|uniref:Multiple sugar transport system permease protein n=1 Tax=Ruania alba TaxID=648782 RepID=A0A1H5NCP6_9MICO|nr:carbohydrate ABC transporter permease [Ruania alba]SEE99315.1 multiple sugar transport system permease protein [Ruania alba]
MIRRTIRYVLLTAISVVWLVPLYLLVVNAITPVSEYAGTQTWWPSGFGLLENLEIAVAQADIGTGLLNSTLYAVAGGVGAVLVAALASFAVVVMPVQRPAVWFWLIYSGTLLPLQIFLPPLFRAYNSLSVYDTQAGMIAIYAAICIPFAHFLIRNYLTTIPEEISEAAQLDGAGWLRLFLQIHLPLLKSILLAAFVFQFTWIWNDLLFGITLSTSPEIRPVQAALAQLTGGIYSVGPPVALATALVVSIPTLVLFLSAQRFFAASLTMSR